FPSWRDKYGKTGEVSDLLQDGDLVAAVQDAVDRANRSVSRAESIRKFTILADEVSVEGGRLTPTLKLKRNVVLDRFSRDIAELYATQSLAPATRCNAATHRAGSASRRLTRSTWPRSAPRSAPPPRAASP